MKSKLLIATLCVGLVSQRWALSQTDTNSVATNAPATSEAAPAAQTDADAASQTAPAIATTNTATGPDTNATTISAPDASASATSSNETTTVTTTTSSNETTTVTTSNTPAMTPPTAGSADETAGATPSTNAPVSTAASVLPIQFQDVPITTAIENLARLAEINYLLDPKIGYGQPDQNGQIKPEPTISVRWENISARQALLAVLDNYGLQLDEDAKTKIARITIKNPNAPPPLITRVIQLKYASVSNMVDAVESALTDKRSRVVMDSRTSQLVVVATENEQDAVDTMVDRLDKPTRQVLIETRFMEVSSSPSTTRALIGPAL